MNGWMDGYVYTCDMLRKEGFLMLDTLRFIKFQCISGICACIGKGGGGVGGEQI